MNKILQYFSLAVVGTSIALLSPSLSLAGKPERDKADELKTSFQGIAQNVKSSCGCDVTVDAKWDSYTSVDNMIRLLDSAKGFEEAAKTYCEKPVDKEVFCKNVSGVMISFAKEGKPTLTDKVFSAVSSDYSYCTSDSYLEILNKL